MFDEPEFIKFDYWKIIAETDKAWLLDMEDYEIWLPRSQCEINEDDCTIEVPEWLAEEEGMA